MLLIFLLKLDSSAYQKTCIQEIAPLSAFSVWIDRLVKRIELQRNFRKKSVAFGENTKHSVAFCL